jgi:hypothetical protein
MKYMPGMRLKIIKAYNAGSEPPPPASPAGPPPDDEPAQAAMLYVNTAHVAINDEIRAFIILPSRSEPLSQGLQCTYVGATRQNDHDLIVSFSHHQSFLRGDQKVLRIA